jgi:ring-1,2-phenylacetyl-CoA epoxidase subunit PaaB
MSHEPVEETVYEVFGQTDRGEPYVQLGSLPAADPEMGLMLARELFSRRGEVISLWLVERQEIHATERLDGDLIRGTDRTYRMGEGYRVTVEKRQRLRRVKP